MSSDGNITNRALDILVLPDILPYPPVDGGKLCVFGLIDYLRKYHRIQILLIAYSANDATNIRLLAAEWPEVQVHYIEQFDNSANAKRPNNLKYLKQKIKNLYHKLSTLNAKTTPVVNAYERYDAVHSVPFYPHSEKYIKKLNAVLAKTHFDIIQTEFTRMLNLAAVLPDDTKKVFVQIESRADTLHDYGISNNFDAGYIKHVAGNAEFLEYAYMSQYHAILTLNEADKLKIENNVPATVKVFTSPFGILDREINKPELSGFNAENLIFMGSENHYPNADALDWFMTDIVANFKTIPFKKLYVTGSWSEGTRKKHEQHFNFIDFVGFVDDLAPYLENSVAIVPIRIGGGGIRSKILSAMNQGAPVVATSLSSVGIKGQHLKELLIADDARDFAGAIDTLFTNKSLAQQLSTNAYNMVLTNYSQTSVGVIRNSIYHEICAK